MNNNIIRYTLEIFIKLKDIAINMLSNNTVFGLFSSDNLFELEIFKFFNQLHWTIINSTKTVMIHYLTNHRYVIFIDNYNYFFIYC